MEGTVKFFKTDKGFGFITEKETDKEYFVHASGIPFGAIEKDDVVTFSLVDGKKGQICDNVQHI